MKALHLSYIINIKKHNFPQLLIGHNYANLKSGAFSLDMSISYNWLLLIASNGEYFRAHHSFHQNDEAIFQGLLVS